MTDTSRPITLFTGQWADLPLTEVCEKASLFGFDGLELACWGDHFNIHKALHEPDYIDNLKALLDKHNLKCYAISNHLVGQAVCDRIDSRHQLILPKEVWGDGNPKEVQKRAAEEMKLTARAANAMGINIVNGFTGSSIWGDLYFFPPLPPNHISDGFRDFSEKWTPILDVFLDSNVKFALEVHPSEIAYDIPTTERSLKSIKNHPAFGFNFDPSHLLWQGIDPVEFINSFQDRIFHCHMKDVAIKNDNRSGILGSHLEFGDPRRGWDFRSVGRGDVDFDAIIRALNRINYTGPLSVEWEDPDMCREHGAEESCAYVRTIDFKSTNSAFDDAFSKE